MAGKVFNPDKAEKLVDPEREKYLPPEEYIQMLQIKETDNIADLGAGNGYFTLPFARFTHETVYGVDLEPRMMEKLKERAEEAGLDNIEYLLSNLESINLPDHCVEKIFAAFVLHEIPHLEKAVSEIDRILKPGGRIVILEWKKTNEEPVMGPASHERLSSADLAKYFESHGLLGSIIHPQTDIYAVILDKKDE